jgi:hypothetical protein
MERYIFAFDGAHRVEVDIRAGWNPFAYQDLLEKKTIIGVAFEQDLKYTSRGKKALGFTTATNPGPAALKLQDIQGVTRVKSLPLLSISAKLMQTPAPLRFANPFTIDWTQSGVEYGFTSDPTEANVTGWILETAVFTFYYLNKPPKSSFL